MRRFQGSTYVPAPPRVVFDVIADVESYPRFVSGCVDASVEAGEADDARVARLTIRQAGFEDTITTLNRHHCPDRVEMELVAGPMKSLHGTWTCAPDGQGCRLGLDLRFAFAGKAQEFLLGRAFEKTCAKLLEATAAEATRRAPA